MGGEYGSAFLTAYSDASLGINNVLDSVQSELKKEIKQTSKAIDGLEKGVAKLNSVKRKVRTKEGVSNLYAQVVEQQLQATSAALAHSGIELISLNAALEALDDYEYVLDDAEFFIQKDPTPGAVDMEGVA